MHDAKGRALKVGDTVLVPATITELQATEEYCNVSIESVYGRRPGGQKEKVHAINTGVLLRANPGDELPSDFSNAAAHQSIPESVAAHSSI